MSLSPLQTPVPSCGSAQELSGRDKQKLAVKWEKKIGKKEIGKMYRWQQHGPGEGVGERQAGRPSGQGWGETASPQGIVLPQTQ